MWFAALVCNFGFGFGSGSVFLVGWVVGDPVVFMWFGGYSVAVNCSRSAF